MTDTVRIPLADTVARASVEKRLWLGAGAVAAFIGTVLVAMLLKPVNPHDEARVGLDFIAFYTAGNFVVDGRTRDLYDIPKIHRFQYDLAAENGVDLRNAVGPWWNPPFYAWVFVPIAKLPYLTALHVWWIVNLTCAFIAVTLLCRWLAAARGADTSVDASLHTEDLPRCRVGVLAHHLSSFDQTVGEYTHPTAVDVVGPAPADAASQAEDSRNLINAFNGAGPLSAPRLVCRVGVLAHRLSSCDRTVGEYTHPTDLAESRSERPASGAAKQIQDAPISFHPTHPVEWRTWLLVAVLMMLSTPFIHAITHGQNTCMSLLIVTVAVMFWRTARPIAAGLVTGLMFYKPQLGAVLSVMLVLSLGWRAMIGLSITAVALLLASLALPGALHDFLHQMPKNVHYVQCDLPYLWDRHVTFRAFWRLWLQGYPAGEMTPIVSLLSYGSSAAIGAGLIWALICTRANERMAHFSDADRVAGRDRLISATIACTPLLMPFYFDYDQLLLMIPAVLFATSLIRRDRSVPLPAADRLLLRIWPIQYAWLMFNPDLAGAIHVNLAVLFLTAVAGLLVRRCHVPHRTAPAERRPAPIFTESLAA